MTKQPTEAKKNELAAMLQDMAVFFCKRLFGLPYRFSVIIDWTGSQFSEYSPNYGDRAFITINMNGDYEVISGGIYINPAEHDCDLEVLGTLLHELIHYELAYRGYEFRDKSRDFIDECHRYGVTSNYDYVWDSHRRAYIEKADRDKMREYLKIYMDVNHSAIAG